MTKVPKIVVISADARQHLRARKISHLGSSPTVTNRRAEIAEWVNTHGGASRVLEEVMMATTPLPLERPKPAELEQFLWSADEDVRRETALTAEALWAKIAPTTTSLVFIMNNPEHFMKRRLLDCFPSRTDWAAVIAREALLATHYWEVSLLFETLADPDLIVEVARRFGIPSAVANVLLTFGEQAGPVLGGLLAVAKNDREVSSVLRSLVCVGSPEAANALAAQLRKKEVKQRAFKYFGAFPHLARAALGEIAAKKTQTAELARMILDNVERAASEPRASNDMPEGDVVVDVDVAADAPIASDDDLPAMLRSPPWVKAATDLPVAPRAKLIVRNVEIPTEPVRLHWSERTRRRNLAKMFDQCVVLATDEAIEEATRALLSDGQPIALNASLPRSLILSVIANTPTKAVFQYGQLEQIITLFGEEALGALNMRSSGSLPLAVIETPKFASRELRDTMHFSWMHRSPKTAALGLIPIAVGEEGEARELTEKSLRYLARVGVGHRALIEDVADSFGAEVRASVDEILAWDESKEPWTEMPALPSWYKVKELRPVLLKNGKALPSSILERLDRILIGTALHDASPRVDAIREACDTRSLAEHAWHLARTSDINGTNHSVLHVIAHVADDEVVRRLTPTLKGDAIPRTLGAMGTDAALMELFTILARVTRPGLSRRPPYAFGTEEAISAIAVRRGMDADALEDRFVPTFNLDTESGVVLDFGKNRAFRVTFDQRLVPIFTDENGEIAKALPRGKGLDAEKLKAARVRVEELTEDVRAIASLRSATLERAMSTGRTWSQDDFIAFWVKHPVMIHLVRGVIWEAKEEDANKSAERLYFRVTEDGSFATIDDEPISLVNQLVGVAHPARLKSDELARWANLFADYKLLQPFEQLSRELSAFSEQDLKQASLTRWLMKFDAKSFGERIKRSGWVAASRRVWVFPFEADVYARIEVQRRGGSATVTVAKDRRFVTFGEVDDVVRCEVMRALTQPTE